MDKENSVGIRDLEKCRISVIIPTLNAQGYLTRLIDSLEQQVDIGGNLYLPMMEIIVVDSSSDDDTLDIAKKRGIRAISVERKNYDHGGTRNMAWKAARGEFIFFLTQDALPADNSYISNLISYFETHEKQLVMISGRQIPYAGARPSEVLTRKFNYPEKSNVRTQDDVNKMGIKAFFFSDACSVYRRSFLTEMGGFEEPILTNEDMLMAKRALEKGYNVGYCAEARVYHSHNFTLKQQYKRNFDVSVFLTMYQNELCVSGVTGEGMRMVLYIEKELFKSHHFGAMVYCLLESFSKWMGNRAGKKYEKMNLQQILKKTSNPTFWRNSGV